MRKLVMCFAILALLLLPGMAMADSNPVDCTDIGEVDTWSWLAGESDWTYHPAGDTTTMARCWKTEAGIEKTGCNKGKWEIGFTNHASMAQWSYWSISNTRWDWKIRKPGLFAADCITLWIQSNGPIDIGFDGFDDLKRPEDDEEDPDTHGEGTLHNIVTWYSLVPFTPGPGVEAPDVWDADQKGWLEAAEMDSAVIPVDDSAELHAGLYWKLFNKIDVKNCNSVGEYHNKGTITIALTNIKPFIDSVSGTWVTDYSPLP